MTPLEAKQLLESPILKAFSEGKIIQFFNHADTWIDLRNLNGHIENTAYHPDLYRIKPEPAKAWAWRIKGYKLPCSSLYGSRSTCEQYFNIALSSREQAEREIIELVEVVK